MMARSYRKKTARSKRKVQNLENDTVTVQMGADQVCFQMVLPMSDLLFDVAEAIEHTASQAGLLMMKGLIDDEVKQIVGKRYAHQADRTAMRWGREEGHLIFAGRKVGVQRPRVRSVEGQEIPLQRYQAFAHPQRMEKAVSQRILRRVSMRDYAGVLDDLCDGYGIDKSSVSRQFKAASRRQLRELLERPLGTTRFCVILLDGKQFQDFTLITALGVDEEGRKQVLGLWPGATENAQVCGDLLDDLLARGLATDRPYLFILDGSKALAKAVQDRFGGHVLIQRCRLHKERNILSYLPNKHHKMAILKLRRAWSMRRYDEACDELRRVQDWLASINEAAARSLAEGFEQTLTVNRLGLSPQLYKRLSTTNMIESCFSRAGDLCGRVKRWRDGNMAWRWAGTVLLEAEKHFRRMGGYRELPLLIEALSKHVDNEEAVA